MNANQFISFGSLMILAALVPPARADTPLGTAFTYQGQLKQNGVPIDGAIDFEFSLWDAATSGRRIGSAVNRDGVAVNNGLFTVAVSFPASAYNGYCRWLEIAVCVGCRDPFGFWQTLTPRQELKATPYAMGLHLPLTQTVDTSADGITLTNHGTGGGAHFNLTDLASTGAALEGSTAGTGNAIHGMTTGTGHAGYFENSNASNIESALNVTSNGSAYAFEAHGHYAVHGKATHPAGYGGVFSGSGSGGSGQAFLVTGDSDFSGKVRVGSGGTFDDSAKIAVLGGTDASDGGYLVLGDVRGKNISLDNDDIQARDGFVGSTLYLNRHGGDVKVGGTLDVRYAISLTGTCPSGLKVVGGGCDCGDCVIDESRPADDGGGWVCGCIEPGGGFCGAPTPYAYAICISVK